jgi:hypothetical protein
MRRITADSIGCSGSSGSGRNAKDMSGGKVAMDECGVGM